MPLRFTLRQLEYFVAVGEAGSIALAAEKVNISSPSISTALSQLEQEFGLQLFVRKHAQGLSLTQAGRQFMEQAKTMLRDAEGLNRLAGEIAGRVQGQLTVGCLLTFAQRVVPALRRSFAQTYPQVQIRQLELDQSGLIDRLRLAEIDVALTYDLDIPTDLNFLPLAELPPYAFLSVDHPLATRAEVSASELAEYPMVLLDLPLSVDYFLSCFEAEGLKPRIAERTRDMAVMRSLVANGFGYSIANFRPLSPLAPDGREIRFVPIKGAIRPLRLGLLTAGGAAHVLTVKAFLDHCRAEIDATGIPGMYGSVATR